MNILKDSFFLTLSKGIRTTVMMIVVMVMTRLISVEVYGTYRQLVTLSTIILAIAPIGIPTSVSYYYKNVDFARKSKLFTNTSVICFICGIMSSLLLFIFRYQISASLNINGIDNFIYVFSFYIFIIVSSSFIENLFVSAEFAGNFSIFNILYYILYLAVLIVVIYRDNSLPVIIFAMAAMEALRFIFLLTWIALKLKLRFVPDFSFLKEQLTYCIPLSLVGILQVLSTQLDKLLVSGYFTSSEFAIYSTGTMEIPVVNLITISLATAALPHMSKEYNTNHDIRAALKIWGKITLTGAAVIFPVFFILGFYNRAYIGFLFSEKYFSAIPVFLIRLLRLPLSCTVFGNMLVVMRKQKVTIFCMLVSIVVNVICNILLIPVMGMAGATLSGIIMQITVILLLLHQISRYSKVKIKELLPYGGLLKIFVCSFLVVFPLYLLSRLFTLHYIIKFFIFGPTAFIACICTFACLKLVDFNIAEKLSFFKKIHLFKRTSPEKL